MKQLTVKDLTLQLINEIKKGNGDKVLVAADDPEGNGYHGVFFGLTSDPNTVKECIEGSNGIYDSVTEDPSKIIIVG